MPLDKTYLEYPLRRHGMDHDLYPWTNLFERKPVEWPNGAKVALWITPVLEFFPLTPNEGPFRAPGHMVTPYPDYRTYTTRDYGARVGIQRIFKALDAAGVKATVPMNAAVAQRMPGLVKEVTTRGWEVAAHGLDMNALHYGGLDEETERKQITETLEVLKTASGGNVAGWLSPARSESENTLKLLAEAGVQYICDWVNDDMPYAMTTEAGEVVSMPHTSELEDRHLLINLGHTEAAYEEQVLDAFTLFRNEADKHGGRILHLALTPYVIGQPFRIRSLRNILSKIMDDKTVWTATGAEILTAWKAQQT
ncbi:MAG: polysaccharide deacetylase family protein [Pseudomonadota bacterium]